MPPTTSRRRGPPQSRGPQATSAARSGGIKSFVFKPLTPSRWEDLEFLFGPRGACAGCWCTWFLQSTAEYRKNQGAANRRMLKRRVDGGAVPGLLAYASGSPVGWVAVEPRPAYARLAKSRTLAPVDDRPAWAAPCFFVARPWRGKGLTRKLLDAAAGHARKNGAHLIEGYPAEASKRTADAWMYVGAVSTFEKAGFKEIVRRSRTRPIMRKEL